MIGFTGIERPHTAQSTTTTLAKELPFTQSTNRKNKFINKLWNWFTLTWRTSPCHTHLSILSSIYYVIPATIHLKQ